MRANERTSRSTILYSKLQKKREPTGYKTWEEHSFIEGKKGKKEDREKEISYSIQSLQTDSPINQSSPPPSPFVSILQLLHLVSGKITCRGKTRESVIPFQFIHRENCFFVKGGEEREKENYYPFPSFVHSFLSNFPLPLPLFLRDPPRASLGSNKLYSYILTAHLTCKREREKCSTFFIIFIYIFFIIPFP